MPSLLKKMTLPRLFLLPLAVLHPAAGDSDSDASQQSEVEGQGDHATVVEVFRDEDESEAESEEEFELSGKEQRLLHEAYETYATSGERWIQQRAHPPQVVEPSS